MCTSKILTDLCFPKQKIKQKILLQKNYLQCFSSKKCVEKT